VSAFLDSKGRPIVAVTGMGVVTSLGVGKDENWRRLTAGESGVHRLTRFPAEGLRTTIAGSVDFVPVEPFSAPALSLRLAELAAEEAIGQAAIGRPGDFPGPLFMAVPPVEFEWPQRTLLAEACLAEGEAPTQDGILRHAEAHPEWHTLFLFGGVAERTAERFGTKGTPISLSTACASGASAIQLGVEALRRGETDAALCIGTDGSIHAEALIRFSLLSALSTRNEVPEAAAKPFAKNRDGFVMAEGAAALVLETLESARARGATVLGVIKGSGERADSFHRTRSNPDGSAIIGAIENAIEDAGIAPERIDYVNAHGTGTPENDKMESMACAAVFGERMARLPISSNKSMIGHTLTAAGAVEAVFSLMTIERGVLPPTINYEVPDPAIPLDVVPNVARPTKVDHVMSNSFGFGGQNAVLVFAREGA
jgi:3-oxoacyl-[acyl-carrier-protein] synthase II